MKPASLVLAGSLAANVALVALYQSPRSPRLDADATTSTPAGQNAGARRAPAPTPTDHPTNPDPAAAHVAALWRQLRTDDLPAFVARLRAAGFPPDVVRSLIAAEVEARFVGRRQAIFRELADPPYWTTKTFGARGLDPKTMAALAELGLEQKKLMTDLIGPSAEAADHPLLRIRFGDLSAEKYNAVQNVTSDYASLRSKLFAEAAGLPLGPEARDQMALLAKEERADLEKILTPAELEAYELRSSPTADLLRNKLSAFAPTENEFRAIFRATAAAEKNYGPYNDATREDRGKIGAAILERALATMSPERFEQFRRSTTFTP